MTDNIHQQRFYFAKYDNSRDYSRVGDSSSAPVGEINKGDSAARSIFDEAKNRLQTQNIQKAQEQNILSGFKDFSRTISAIYSELTANFSIKYDVANQQDAARADNDFENFVKEIEIKAQQQIDEKMKEAAQRVADKTAMDNKPITEETRALRKQIKSRGFSQHSIAHIQTSETSEISFIVLNDKYLVEGKQVDEATFLKAYDDAMAEYNKAKANGKASEFCEPYLENFEEYNILDNHDGTFTEDAGVYGKYVYNYDGSVKESYSRDGSRKYDRKNKTTEIDADKLNNNDKLEELYFDDKNDFSFSNMTLGDAEIKDNSGNIVFVKKNGKFYDNQGNEVDFAKIKKYLEENKGEKIIIKGLPSGFGVN